MEDYRTSATLRVCDSFAVRPDSVVVAEAVVGKHLCALKTETKRIIQMRIFAIEH